MKQCPNPKCMIKRPIDIDKFCWYCGFELEECHKSSCSNGHLVGFYDKFCTECGEEIKK
jgi:hypothetical protein